MPFPLKNVTYAKALNLGIVKCGTTKWRTHIRTLVEKHNKSTITIGKSELKFAHVGIEYSGAPHVMRADALAPLAFAKWTSCGDSCMAQYGDAHLAF